MPKRATKRKMKAKRGGFTARPPYVVFVSHSSSDLWIATAIAERVAALGAKPWLDKKDLEGGDVIMEKIIRGIDACHEAIVLVSPTSIESQWVIFEIGAVCGQHKRVTPILNYVDSEAIAPLRSLKAINLNEIEQFLIELKRRIDQWHRGER